MPREEERSNMFDELVPFSWMADQPEDSYSDVYNKLLEDGHSFMTEEQCRKYAAMVGSQDIDVDIQEIQKLREKFKGEYTNLITDGSLESFCQDAYPYEILFTMRY